MEHLLARYLEILPLSFPLALPMNEEWNNKPYLGVFARFLRAWNSAFSAPRIWTVEAGYLTRLERPPACEMSLAPSYSPMRLVRLGATLSILERRYYWIVARNSTSFKIRAQSSLRQVLSVSDSSCPMEVLAASRTYCAMSASVTISSTASNLSWVAFDFSPKRSTRRVKTTLSETIFASSGKCHPYHSLIRMHNVLTSLSKFSSTEIQLMIGLSCLLTSN